MNILLIEDSSIITEGLLYLFRIEKINIISVNNLKEASLYLKYHDNIDMIILDIMLPDGNGISYYKSNLKNYNIPVLFLSAVSDDEIIVNLLECGCEDYITKPFSSKELIARVNKILRNKRKENIITIKDLTYDTNKLTLYRGDEEIILSPLELKIFNYLALNFNYVVSRDILLDKVWDWTGNFVDDHTITVYLQRIRDKIGKDIIKTIKGIGYRIDL